MIVQRGAMKNAGRTALVWSPAFRRPGVMNSQCAQRGRAAMEVAQVSQPAVSPISNRQGVESTRHARSFARFAGWKRCDQPRKLSGYTGWETCATVPGRTSKNPRGLRTFWAIAEQGRHDFHGQDYGAPYGAGKIISRGVFDRDVTPPGPVQEFTKLSETT